MSKILIDEATVKLALEALKQIDNAMPFPVAKLAQAALREALAEQPAQQEPFGYFKAEPFGWTDCAETDEGAVALYTTSQPAQTATYTCGVCGVLMQMEQPAPVQQEPWGACIYGRVFVGRLPEHARKFSEDEGVPIQWLYTSPPAQQEPVALGPLAKRRVFDYIRGAYDLGYNDARNEKATPGDSAPGYKGRDVEADHGSALFHALEAITSPPAQRDPSQDGPDYEDGPDEEGFRGPRPWNGFDTTTPQPAQRTWVGLTDEEAMQICVDCGCLSEDWLTLLDAIEAKLRSKNT